MKTYTIEIDYHDNDANLSTVSWICPKCSYHNKEYNTWESIDVDIMNISTECNECETYFDIEIPGSSDWQPSGKMFLTEHED